MTVFVGVDGGQSQVRLRLSGSSEVQIAAGVAHLEGDTVQLLAAAIGDAWQRTGSVDAIERIALGITTMPADEITRRRLADGVSEVTGAREVWLMGDAVTSHAGAFPEQRGIVLVVGTGIACLGVDPDSGVSQRVDGDGFLLGDKGAAFWMGSRGIEAALESADGRGAPTSLLRAATQRFGDPGELAARVHAGDRPADTIAQFAAVVQEHAHLGDAIARDIVESAARELMRTCDAAARIFGDGPVPLAVLGRSSSPGTPLRAAFERILEPTSRFVLVSAVGSSLDGACDFAERGQTGAYAELIWRSHG